MKLQGKVAVVTGASKGIGAEVAWSLAKHGAHVVVNYATSKPGADAVVSSITVAGGKAIAVQGDVANAKQAQGIIQTAIQTYGKLDILVNNAGVFEFAPLKGITPEHFHRQFNVNVLGLLQVTQAAIQHMKQGASIINIGSVITRHLPPQTVVYAATKGAVDAITGVLAKELRPRDIRVNAINPGLVETEGTRAAGSTGSFRQKSAPQKQLGRIGQPADIASAVTFLASKESGWMTGERIVVSGGY